jgi:hypothetical protein
VCCGFSSYAFSLRLQAPMHLQRGRPLRLPLPLPLRLPLSVSVLFQQRDGCRAHFKQQACEACVATESSYRVAAQAQDARAYHLDRPGGSLRRGRLMSSFEALAVEAAFASDALTRLRGSDTRWCNTHQRVAL